MSTKNKSSNNKAFKIRENKKHQGTRGNIDKIIENVEAYEENLIKFN